MGLKAAEINMTTYTNNKKPLVRKCPVALNWKMSNKGKNNIAAIICYAVNGGKVSLARKKNLYWFKYYRRTEQRAGFRFVSLTTTKLRPLKSKSSMKAILMMIFLNKYFRNKLEESVSLVGKKKFQITYLRLCFSRNIIAA